jgi:hypothetical protein
MADIGIKPQSQRWALAIEPANFVLAKKVGRENIKPEELIPHFNYLFYQW